TDAEVTTANLVESTLRLYKYNGSSTVWDLISPGGVDTTLNYVWGNVSGFSTFGIFGNVVSTPSTDTTTADEGSGGGGSGAGGGGVALGVLKEGSMTLNLEYGDNFIFYIKEYKHNAVIINVDTNAVKIRILGMPTDISLNLGQTIDLDLDKNGLYDFRVTLNNITELGGLFTFTILEESRKEEPSEEQKEETQLDAGKLESATEAPAPIPVEEPKPVESPGKSPTAWIIVAIVVIIGIALIVMYQKKRLLLPPPPTVIILFIFLIIKIKRRKSEVVS
ncbi:MAG: hypothetical protein QF436_03850, partial [Candidatus Woesearchaeota archaeon]|nr:hypothetical protein [Candidatus Woesearchaeota archaeon]